MTTIAHQFDDAEQQFQASQLGMWVFLATEVLFFGGLFTGYAVYRWQYPAAFAEGSRHMNVWLGAVNTAVLLLSSLTMALAVHRAQTGRRGQLVALMFTTAALGAVFLGVKAWEYHDKVTEHLLPGRSFHLEHLHGFVEDKDKESTTEGTIINAAAGQLILRVENQAQAFVVDSDTQCTLDGKECEVTDLKTGQLARVASTKRDTEQDATTIDAIDPRHVELMFSFYFAMTGLHALHMVVGVALVAVICFLAWRGRFSPEYYTPVEMTGLYWHFVDIVWVFLFPLLYLIR